MTSRSINMIFGLLLLAVLFVPSSATADCLGQCESMHQTCLRGCTPANAKQCVDSCFRGTSACRSRCRSEAPAGLPKIGAAACGQIQKACVKS